jgi:hypothetical protein
MVVALAAGCAQQTGSTQVRVAPIAEAGTAAAAEYELRASDGHEVGRLIIAEGAAMREGPHRHIVRSGLTIENRSDRPLAIPASELYLSNQGPQQIAVAEVSDGAVPEMLVVGPGERKSFVLGFILRDQKVDDVRSPRLHWLVLHEGAPVGEQVTELAAIEKSRQYRDYGMRNVSAMDDVPTTSANLRPRSSSPKQPRLPQKRVF